jgi:DNA-binding transcriptional LysR family regulator
MDWDNYRAFLEVYRSGDLGHAAHGLEMSVPTVRRRLDAVESQIGFPLFERTPRGLSPTPVARRLVHSIAAMSDFAAVAGMLKEGPTQTVTVAADESLALYISDAIWTDLRRSHPAMGITVLTRRPHSGGFGVRADIAISHLRPKGLRGAARCPGALAIGLYAHRDYVARAGAAQTVADLGRFTMVAAESNKANAWLESRLRIPAATLARSAFRTDSHAGQVAAVEAGVGVGVCYVGLADAHPDLVRILPAVTGSLECWVWSMRSQLKGAASNRIHDWLLDRLAEQVASDRRVSPPRSAPATFDNIAA